MKTKNVRNLFFFSVIAMAISSCVKEGPRGPAGQNGVDGNANVIASPWISPLSWSLDTFNAQYYFDVNSNAITPDIVENGAILAYMSVPGDVYNADVRPLPAYALDAYWDFLIPDYQQIEFTVNSNTEPGTTGYNFRFILISSSASLSLKSASINGYKKSELQNMPYKEVCKILGIKE